MHKDYLMLRLHPSSRLACHRASLLECDLSGAFCHALVPIRQAGLEALAVSSRYTVTMWEEGGKSCRDE